jgi:hypothetical protein
MPKDFYRKQRRKRRFNWVYELETCVHDPISKRCAIHFKLTVIWPRRFLASATFCGLLYSHFCIRLERPVCDERLAEGGALVAQTDVPAEAGLAVYGL